MIYKRHTGRTPGLAYRKDRHSNDHNKETETYYDGPFFRFVKTLLSIVVDNPNITDVSLHTSIRKVLGTQRNLHKLRKKYWPEYARTCPFDVTD
jgi:hypothetical protein